MAESAGEKKHSASDQRRRRAREEGQVVRSQDLASAAILLIAVGILRWRGPVVASGLAEMLTDSLQENKPQEMSNSTAIHILSTAAIDLAWLAAPIMLAMLVAGIACNVLQTGPMLTVSRITPNLSHIDPFAGTRRMFSIASVMRLTFGLFKVAIVSAVAYWALAPWHAIVISMFELPLNQVAGLIFKSCIDMGLWIGGALFVLALLEYAFQWWKFEQDLMMTDQEVRDEAKEFQGDPQVAMKRKQIQRQMAMARMKNDVPSADVVVTNPTELAVALKYDPQTMPAPVVVAKGAGLIAQRIRRIALEHEIPIVERKPLAQILYKTVDVGKPIPLEQYQAVAEVLKYVYQLKGKRMPTAA
jgi:flagellar biosynthetic protein FlhB